MLNLEMAQGQLGVDLILISATDPGAVDIAGIDQVGHDPLHRPGSDSGPLSDVGHSDRRVFGKAQEDDQMAGDESPLAFRRARAHGGHYPMLGMGRPI